jgi:zinc transport system ATP-binding protein
MSLDVVSAEKVCFQYNSAEVLTDITFRLTPGDYLGLVGPNGSGKTTLIKLVLGFLRSHSGMISLFGQPPSAFRDWHRVGYLPQRINSFNPHFPATVKEVVGLGLLSRKGFPKRFGQKDNRLIHGALDLMDITEIKDEMIGQLSGGQQQRVLIAKALVAEPELLILDEPAAALDPETRENFFALLKGLNQNRNTTVIMITHDMGSIGRYASALLYLDKRVIFYGSFESFCVSEDMTGYFGRFSQHLICHRHDSEIG